MKKPKTIGDQLRQFVIESGESRYRIAKETGISDGNLSRFVHGRAGIELANIDILAEYLGLELVKTKERK